METKTAVRARFAAIHPQILALSHRIHAHPEIGFEEEQACTWLCEVLADTGFRVHRASAICPQRLAPAPAMDRCNWSSAPSMTACPGWTRLWA